MLSTPILFLIFNRPETTERVFALIRQQKPKFLYIAADGPRSGHPDDVELCQAARNVVSKIDWDCTVKTLFRDKNLGCGLGPSQAITWFFDNVEEGIILEDDIITDESFFTFCSEMLERYRDNPRIMHISGCYFLESYSPPPSQSYYFTNHIHVWGWATWKRAWMNYDYDMKDYKRIKSDKRLKAYYGGYYIFWKDIFNRMANKGNDIWDYQWMFTIYNHNGVAINPTANLTQNIGFNSNGTHTLDPESIFTTVELSSMSELIHPSSDKVDDEKDENYYKLFLDFDLQAEIGKRTTIWKLKRLLRSLKQRSPVLTMIAKHFRGRR